MLHVKNPSTLLASSKTNPLKRKLTLVPGPEQSSEWAVNESISFQISRVQRKPLELAVPNDQDIMPQHGWTSLWWLLTIHTAGRVRSARSRPLGSAALAPRHSVRRTALMSVPYTQLTVEPFNRCNWILRTGNSVGRFVRYEPCLICSFKTTGQK